MTDEAQRLGTALGLEPAHLSRRDHGRARHAGPAQSPPPAAPQPATARPIPGRQAGSRDALLSTATRRCAPHPGHTHQRPTLAPRTHRCPPLGAWPFLCALAKLFLPSGGNRYRCPRVPTRGCARRAGPSPPVTWEQPPPSGSSLSLPYSLIQSRSQPAIYRQPFVSGKCTVNNTNTFTIWS